jgi:predicted RNase H-like nuclease
MPSCTYVGVDGFRWGWVAAWIDGGGNQGFDFSSSLNRLLGHPNDRCMIDVPIGLPSRGYRQCDTGARRLLGSSVFLGARRGLWDFHSYDDANRHFHNEGQPGVSQQLWNIRSKIREVDAIMTRQRQDRLCETHPELIFWRLNGQAPLESKKTEAGRLQRSALLKRHGFTKIDHWLGWRFGTGVGRDDLLDACACAIAARTSKDKLPIGESPRDDKGLRMEIWY